MISGSSWDESIWTFNWAIEQLKSFAKKNEDINYLDPRENEVNIDSGFTTDDFTKYEFALRNLIRDVVIIIGTSLSESQLEDEIDDLIRFEKSVDDFARQFKVFKLLRKKNKELTKINRNIIWLNHLQEFLLANKSSYNGPLDEKLDNRFLEFLKTTPNR